MEKFVVEDIPAVLWGEPSTKIYIWARLFLWGPAL